MSVRRIVGLVPVVMVMACRDGGGGDSSGDTDSGDTDVGPGYDVALAEQMKSELETAYGDPMGAVAAGYISTAEYVYHPELGAMGIHVLNPVTLTGEVEALADPFSAAVINYDLTEEGELVLLSGEWLVYDPEEALIADPPEIFGMTMWGPMPGHNPQMPTHWDIHAYFWNPDPALAHDIFGEFYPQQLGPSWKDDYNASLANALVPELAAAYTQTDGTCTSGLGTRVTNPAITGTPAAASPNSLLMHDFDGDAGPTPPMPVALEWETTDATATLFGGKAFWAEGTEGKSYFRVWMTLGPSVFGASNPGIVCP